MNLHPGSKKTLVKSTVDPPVMRQPLRLDDSMSSAGAKLCRMFTAVLRGNVQGAIKGEDTEHVHQMRVAVRKLRFVLQFWNPLFDKKKTNSLNEELKWLAGELGQARDADILLQRFEAQWEGAIGMQERFFPSRSRILLCRNCRKKELRRRNRSSQRSLPTAINGFFHPLRTFLTGKTSKERPASEAHCSRPLRHCH